MVWYKLAVDRAMLNGQPDELRALDEGHGIGEEGPTRLERECTG